MHSLLLLTQHLLPSAARIPLRRRRFRQNGHSNMSHWLGTAGAIRADIEVERAHFLDEGDTAKVVGVVLVSNIKNG